MRIHETSDQVLEGRYVFDLAFDGAISVAVCSHPTFIKVPEDLEVSEGDIIEW